MYCSNCGTRLDEGVRYCPYCGTPVQTAQTLQGDVTNVSISQPRDDSGAEFHVKSQEDAEYDANKHRADINKRRVDTNKHRTNTSMHRVDTNNQRTDTSKHDSGKQSGHKKWIIAGVSACVALLCLLAASMVLHMTHRESGLVKTVDDPRTAEESASSREQNIPKQEEADVTASDGMDEDTENGESNRPEEEQQEEMDPAELLRDFENNLPHISLEGMKYSYSARPDEGIWETLGLEATDGVIADRLMDLDQDGLPELLVFRIEGHQNPDYGNYYHNLLAEAYEVIGDEVVCSDTELISAGILADNVENVRVMLKDDHFLCVDTYILSFLAADGAYGEMNLSFYNGNEWVPMSECSCAGSDWTGAGEGAEQKAFCDDLRTIGLYKTADLMSKWDHYYFSTADPGLEVLFKIRVDNNRFEPDDQKKGSVYSTVHMIMPDSQTDYYCEDSAKRVLRDEEIASLTKEQLRIARNEIYARNGWNFEDDSLRKYFNDKAWYRPCWDIGNIDDTGLTDVEIANRDLLVNAEK